MQRNFFLLYAGCSLLICNSSCSGNSTSVSQDTTAAESIVPLGHDEFIQEVIDYRKTYYTGQDMPEFYGKMIHEGNEGFAIYNFSEVFQDGSLNLEYAIVVNGDCDKPEISSNHKVFSDLSDWLIEKRITATLYEGNFSIAWDTQRDNSRDFNLRNVRNDGLNMVETKRIVLFDGQKKLIISGIYSNSVYQFVDNKLIGVQEKMYLEEDGNNVPTIYVDHTEGMMLPGDTTHVGFSYKLAWKWNSDQQVEGGGYWKTGFVANYKNCKAPLRIFQKKRNSLTFENDTYIMKENCQNGGSDYFQLIPFKTELSDCYQWGDNYDEVSETFLVDIFDFDNYYMLIFLPHEDLDFNINGDRRIGYDKIFYRINKMVYGSDIEVHVSSDGTESFYTDMPDHYFLQRCESY